MIEKVGVVFGVVLVTILFSFIMSYPIMLIWNACVVEAIAVAKPITWMQAWGLSILIKLLSGVSLDIKK